MFSPRFQIGGYAVSHHGFARIIKRMDVMIEIRRDVEIVVIRPATGPWFCMPGRLGYIGDGYLLEGGCLPDRVKIKQDAKSECLWLDGIGGRSKINPWRPWNGEPIPYGLMSPDYWPG
jgi:hypothetical protein